MNGTSESLAEIEPLIEATSDFVTAVLVCTPFTLIDRAAALVHGSNVSIGAQDCHANTKGAHTGDVSAAMLADTGATHVIVGHSERRQDHHETDALVRAKAEAALEAELVPIVCVGETRSEREAEQSLDVVANQLEGSLPAVSPDRSIVIAYEPVWAIGSGSIPSTGEIAEMHAHIRHLITDMSRIQDHASVPILYGGSVNAANSAEIFAVNDVDGGLVGGASLKASDFIPICQSLEQAQ